MKRAFELVGSGQQYDDDDDDDILNMAVVKSSSVQGISYLYRPKSLS